MRYCCKSMTSMLSWMLTLICLPVFVIGVPAI